MPYSDLVLVSNDGTRVEWKYSDMRREFPALLDIATDKHNENTVNLVITLPFSKRLIQFLPIASQLEKSDISWLAIELLLKEIGNTVALRNLKEQLIGHLMKDISTLNCIGLWKKFKNSGSEHVIEIVRFILYNLVKAVIQKEICIQFFRLNKDELFNFLNDNRLNVLCDDDVVTVIDTWKEALPESRETFRAFLYKSVRQNGLKAETKSRLIEKQFKLSEEPVRRPRDQLIAIGGWCHNAALSRIDLYDTHTNKWRKLNNLPLMQNLGYHGGVVANGELYIIGGCDGGKYFNTMKKLTRNMEWVEMAPMFELRCYISNSCVYLDGYIYVCGGMDNRSSRRVRNLGAVQERLRSAERYNVKTNTWEMIANMHSMRSDCAAAAANGKIFVSGGFTGTEVSRSCEVYMPNTNVWQEVLYMPTPRSGHSMVFYGKSLLILGGFDGINRLSSVLEYTPGSRQYKNKPPLLIPRSNFSVGFLGADLIVACGYSIESTIVNVELYNGKEWLPLPNVEQARSALIVVSMPDWDDIAQTLLGVEEEATEVEGQAQVPQIPPVAVASFPSLAAITGFGVVSDRLGQHRHVEGPDGLRANVLSQPPTIEEPPNQI